MFSRIKATASACVTFAGRCLSAGGRVASSVGTVLFSGDASLKYIYRNNEQHHYNNPAIFSMIAINLFVNLVTKIPAIFRNKKPEAVINTTNQQLVNVLDADLNSVTDEEIERMLASNEPASVECYSIFLRALYYFTTTASSCGVFVGTYHAGKILCDFIEAQLQVRNENGEQAKDQEWVYYTVRVLALYLAISSVHSFGTYVGRAFKNNIDKLIELHANGENLRQVVNTRRATTAAIISSLNILSGVAFNYYSTTRSLRGINQDIAYFNIPPDKQIPEWVILSIAAVTSLTGLAIDSITLGPSVYNLLDSLSGESQDNHEEPCWRITMKVPCYTVGMVDALIAGMNSCISVALTMHDVTKVDAYGYVINLGFVCGLSKVACHFSLNVKYGVDIFMDDIQRHMNANQPRYTLLNESQSSETETSDVTTLLLNNNDSDEDNSDFISLSR